MTTFSNWDQWTTASSHNEDGRLAAETTNAGLGAEGATQWDPEALLLPRADAIEAKIS